MVALKKHDPAPLPGWDALGGCGHSPEVVGEALNAILGHRGADGVPLDHEASWAVENSGSSVPPPTPESRAGGVAGRTGALGGPGTLRSRMRFRAEVLGEDPPFAAGGDI